MKNLRTIFLVLLAVVLFSCNPNRVFKEYDKSFVKFRWPKDKQVIFTPDIQDISTNYDMYLALRHVNGFRHSKFTVNVDMETPSGKVFENQFTLQVGDNKGGYAGECAGDICDLEVLVFEDMKFEEAGKYKFTITHAMPEDPVQLVMEFGMYLDKVVEEK